VTGKGGVGKTAVAAALATAMARAERRVLAVEIGRGGLGTVFGAREPLGQSPVRVAPGISAAAIAAEEALGSFVDGVLRLRVLSRRLLESTSFQVLAAAAPGLPEFLVLHALQGFLDARRFGRRVHDVVVVDAPASGHSLPLLAAPQTLGALALADPAHTVVCLVTTPEELAVRETIELHRELADALGLPMAPPIVNALPARRFGAADEATLAHLDPQHPHVIAARFLLARRRDATDQVAALRRALGAPVALPFLYAGSEAEGGIDALAGELTAASDLAA
jgi:anion-transporting  ArsA/GET3 family ATPase